MNIELKAKWLEALRSGKYKQSQGFLNTLNGMCCLGVLCDVVDSSKWYENPDPYSTLKVYPGNPPEDGSADMMCFPPMAITRLADLTNDEMCNLAERNDGGDTFHEIADWIERTL